MGKIAAHAVFLHANNRKNAHPQNVLTRFAAFLCHETAIFMPKISFLEYLKNFLTFF